MNDLPPEAPRLDPVPFIVVDILLVGVAAFIGWQTEAPIGFGYLACIAALVGLGAIVLLYPFVVNHARRQEEALQDRANQIEALARTVGASAEQISIAVSNLPAIAENSARQLKAAEQLPAALQTQLAGLQQQLSATASEENAALRHELDTLRGAETTKLTAALDGLTRATADLARLEALAAKHSSALDAAIAHLPRLADSFGKQASDALRRETAAAVEALHEAAAESGAAIAAATTDARAAFERGVRDAVSHLATQATSNPPFPAHVVAYRPVIATDGPAPLSRPTPPPVEADRRDTVETATESESPAPIVSAIPSGPEKAETASLQTTAPLAASATATEPALASIEPTPTVVADDADLDEPVAQPAPEASPAPAPVPPPAPVAPAKAAADTDSQADAAEEPELGLDPEPAAATGESALSHDGYTRLVATAYIGIGNKLFIRGDGPGLRRDKGVPLQFVSIGKWRWESAELLFPAKVRLYKNDQVECTALGEIVLEPGHHHEVNASF